MTTPTPDQPNAQPEHDDADRDQGAVVAGTDPAGDADDATTTDAGPAGEPVGGGDVEQTNDEGDDPA